MLEGAVREGLPVLATLSVLCAGSWGACVLWYHLPGSLRRRSICSWLWLLCMAVLAGAGIASRSFWPLGVGGLLFLLPLIWWTRMRPSNDRHWADDVSQLLTGTIDGSHVSLHNVRNFAWRSLDDYDVRWESRAYDLDQLASADAVVSHWGIPGIAHAMLTFGFADGRHLVFSVEIRKRRDQRYSAVGGFFRQFETTLVAADERDIIRVRTNVRGEDDFLYPLRMDHAAMRQLFVSYVDAANWLAAHPQFYNSLTSNCTSMVYRMARKIDRGLSWDPRLLLTGYLDGYLYRVGALDRQVSLQELRRRGRISERARATSPLDDFSAAIRLGLQGEPETNCAAL